MAGKPVIVGLGKTGLSCVRYFASKGVPVAVMDSRFDPPEKDICQQRYPEATLTLGGLDEALLRQASEIIISPGVAFQEPAIAACLRQNIPLIGDVELFLREAKAPIIAITGTNAKSTVTSLVGLMVEKAGLTGYVGGNIGYPVLDLLTGPVPDVYVLELSSFQLEATHSLVATVATILNIGEDHCDHHGSMQAYITAKQRIYCNAKMVVVNRDDRHTYPSEIMSLNSRSFGLSVPGPNDFGIIKDSHGTWLAKGHQRWLNTAALRIKGQHNWANSVAALAIGDAFGLDQAPMLQALQLFPGLPHRCQWIAEKNQVQWYNDSKGTNVSSTVAAISGLGAEVGKKIILIAGGDGKEASFSDLSSPVEHYVRHAVLLGKDAKRLGAVVEPVTNVTYVTDMVSAVECAARFAQSGDIVLLSPACASLDMFQNYEHRGLVFTDAVKRL